MAPWAKLNTPVAAYDRVRPEPMIGEDRAGDQAAEEVIEDHLSGTLSKHFMPLATWKAPPSSLTRAPQPFGSLWSFG